MSSARCRNCGERMRVERSRRCGDVQLQYAACTACQEKRKQIVPVSEIWAKPRKK